MHLPSPGRAGPRAPPGAQGQRPAGRRPPGANGRVSTASASTLPFWNFHKAPDVALKGRFCRWERGLTLGLAIALFDVTKTEGPAASGARSGPQRPPRHLTTDNKAQLKTAELWGVLREGQPGAGHRTCEGHQGKCGRGSRSLSQPCSPFSLSPGRDRGGGICRVSSGKGRVDCRPRSRRRVQDSLHHRPAPGSGRD